VTLVLFDIDGTLISSGRAGARGMNRSFERLFGVAGALDTVPLAGRTDRAIVSDVFAELGVAGDEAAMIRLRDAYLEDLAAALVEPDSHPGGVLPGVEPLLASLDARDDVVIGLLTGNFARGAAIKLGHFGLWGRFPFGAFGDVHADRRALVPLAVEAACVAGYPRFEPDQIIIIGDTPADVDCAHAHGARAVAVATGPFTSDVLVPTGAWQVVETLEALTVDTLVSGPTR